jgi:hypothetical protein
LSYKCTIGLETSYIILVHPLHTIMLYTQIWKWQQVTYIINIYIRGNGIEVKCMISSWIQSIISHHPNLLVWCIYFCTFPNNIKLFSPVKLSEPNNKLSIKIGVYGVMFASSVVDRGFKPWSGQTKDYKVGMCCFSTKHAALRSKSKDWLARNQNNVSEWNDMSTHRLLFQWPSTIQIKLSVLV